MPQRDFDAFNSLHYTPFAVSWSCLRCLLPHSHLTLVSLYLLLTFDSSSLSYFAFWLLLSLWRLQSANSLSPLVISFFFWLTHSLLLLRYWPFFLSLWLCLCSIVAASTLDAKVGFRQFDCINSCIEIASSYIKPLTSTHWGKLVPLVL